MRGRAGAAPFIVWGGSRFDIVILCGQLIRLPGMILAHNLPGALGTGAPGRMQPCAHRVLTAVNR